MNIIILFTASAHAWVTHWYIGTTGHHRDMHFCASEFPAGWTDQIELGFNGWNAGSGYRMRGADWDWTRASDHSSGTCGLSGSGSEVWDEDQTYFDNHWGDYSAYTVVNGLGAAKIVFNENRDWSLDGANEGNSSDGNYVRDVAMHEMGHAIGFNHDFSYNAMNVMNYISVDMAKGKARLREDDYVGLVDKKSDNSTGTNLMLSRFRMFLDDETQEGWNQAYDNTVKCVEPSAANSTYANGEFHRPGWLSAVVHTTSASVTALIEWRASPDIDCFQSSTSYIIGSRTPTLSSNDEYYITTPSGGLNFSSVPPGFYYVCAKIDPYDSISETYEADNGIVSEHQIRVRSDGWGCDP